MTSTHCVEQADNVATYLDLDGLSRHKKELISSIDLSTASIGQGKSGIIFQSENGELSEVLSRRIGDSVEVITRTAVRKCQESTERNASSATLIIHRDTEAR